MAACALKPAKSGRVTAVTAAGKHATTRQVVVARASATLSAGASKTLTLTLNSTGRALFAKFGKLKVIVTVSSGGKTIHTITVTVQKAAKKKK